MNVEFIQRACKSVLNVSNINLSEGLILSNFQTELILTQIAENVLLCTLQECFSLVAFRCNGRVYFPNTMLFTNKLVVYEIRVSLLDGYFIHSSVKKFKIKFDTKSDIYITRDFKSLLNIPISKRITGDIF